MSETQNVQVKQPMDPNKKRKITKIITFVGGGIGIIALILFAILVPTETAYVEFKIDGLQYENKIIDENGHIEFNKTPTLEGFDFIGWYDNKEFNGEPIDLSTFEFLKEKKEFKWFGEVKELPETTTVYGKWEFHKYKVEVLDYETREPIVIYDESGQPIKNLEFFVTREIPFPRLINEFKIAYADNISGGEGKVEKAEYERLLKEAESLIKGETINIRFVWNFHLLKNVKFLDENDNPIEKINRNSLKIEYDNEGNEKPVLTVYVKPLPDQE